MDPTPSSTRAARSSGAANRSTTRATVHGQKLTVTRGTPSTGSIPAAAWARGGTSRTTRRFGLQEDPPRQRRLDPRRIHALHEVESPANSCWCSTVAHAPVVGQCRRRQGQRQHQRAAQPHTGQGRLHELLMATATRRRSRTLSTPFTHTSHASRDKVSFQVALPEVAVGPIG